MKITFVINPKAGTRSKKNLPSLIKKNFSEGYLLSIRETESAGHGILIAKEEAALGTDVVIAVGGDGTVNEIAQGLIGTDTALGILPMGSGNGLARHLKIPMSIPKAMLCLLKSTISKMDVGFLNNKLFLCTCGLGFDAKVAHEFAIQKSRGFFTYSKVAYKHFFNYPEKKWVIQVDGVNAEYKGIMFTVANANQFGNDVFIAPKALLQDGKLDLCVLKKVPFRSIPLVLKDLFTKNIHRSRFYTDSQFETIRVENSGSIEAHVDGEPVVLTGDISIDIRKSVLKVFSY